LTPEFAYGLRLMQLARQVTALIYALANTLGAQRGRVLRRCAKRVDVTCYAADRSTPADPVEQLLVQAWPQTRRVDIYERARELRESIASAPLAGRLKFFGATSAEQEAQAIDTAVRRWLYHGRTQIAVVVLDRLVARRARALLERAQVLVRDEVGWALSTTSAATVVGRWLDAVSNDFYHRDCLELLKSPFVFHDQPRDARQQAVWRLERALRATNLRSGVTQYLQLAEQAKDHGLGDLLKRVARAEQLFARNRRKTLRGWITLERSLPKSACTRTPLHAAGTELLELLAGLKADLDADVLRLGLSEWRRWLSRKLEGATFRDRSIESPVVFTTLAATRLRQFDAAIVLGADASHLPGSEPAGTFFNQGVRRELGLPVRGDEIRRSEEELSELLASCADVLVTWQQTRDGEENLLSPLLERR
jgi:ATP-dependent helicase/nuclease subunit B